MMVFYKTKIDRRTAMKWMTVAASTLAVSKPGRSREYIKTPNGYGTDPNLNDPSTPWERILTEHQLQQTAVLCDMILPAEDPHPSASDIGVPDFINEWVSSPYERTKKDKVAILRGLAWLDEEASSRFGKGFVDCSFEQRASIVDTAANGAEGPARDFFDRFRNLTLGGYYSTPEGFEDIGYLGNVAMAHYPGPSAEMIAELDRRMKSIGI